MLGAITNPLLMLGLCETALDPATEYSKTRVAFGKPIGAFQAISHKCANMSVHIETGRYLCYKAAWLHASGQPYEPGARDATAFMGDATAQGLGPPRDWEPAGPLASAAFLGRRDPLGCGGGSMP